MIAGLCESLNAIVETGATVRLIRVRIGATWPRANALDQTRGDSHLEGELLRNGARRLRPGVSEDARVPVPLFSETGITTVFTQSRRLPGGLEGEPEGVCEVRPGVPVPQLPGVRRVPVRDRR